MSGSPGYIDGKPLKIGFLSQTKAIQSYQDGF